MDGYPELDRTGLKLQLIHWADAPSSPELPAEHTHVWSVALGASDDQIAELMPLLSEEEGRRAEQFRFERHRRRFVVARAALRQITGRYLREDPSSLTFQTGRYGKPFLADDRQAAGLHFNVTHAGELALIAFARKRRVGVDVEQIRWVADAEAIAREHFSAGEYAALMALEEGHGRAFLDCWTRKEAFIKAIGEGLTFPLDSFQISLGTDAPVRLLSLKGVSDPSLHWSLHAFEPLEGYVAALAYEGPPTELRGYRFR